MRICRTREVSSSAASSPRFGVSVDRRANGPRLLVEDLEDGARVHLDPLELASLSHARDDDRVSWLLVGPYRGERQ